MAGPPLPPGRHLQLPGRGRTFVREAGGPPGAPALLLLHGWTVNADVNWFASFAALARHFRVVAMDSRGHGRGLRSRRFRLDDCADDAAALVDVLGLGPVVAVGYSMGGALAQLLWRRHPESVASLVLCSTSRVFAEEAGERRYFSALGALALVSRAAPAPVRRWAVHRLDRRPGDHCALDAWLADELHRNDWTAVLEAGAALGGFDSRPWAGEIDVPTSVVVTTSDRSVLPRRQLALAESIPGATVHRVDGGHHSCVVDPEGFVPVLVEACLAAAHPRPAPAPG
ncbi:MAG: alpha/beta hydrolase [Actinomycetota bacterium]|nr:alpha/beta hydrolase [Actinomycetota bacterium]